MPQHGTQIFCGESGASGPLSWMQHERLYQSIFSGNQTEAEYLLSVIAQRANYANIRALFYNVCFILRSAAEEMGVQLPDGNRDFQPERTPQENIAALQSMLQALMSIIREQQKVRTGDRQAEILDHIAQNASDSELCAAKVSRYFEINEKRIYDAVRQATGMSFNEYLLAVRMKQAGKLLCNTQLEVGKISSQCGYQSSSTFYRAFNKFYGISPGDFRRSGGTEPAVGTDGAPDPAQSDEKTAAEPKDLS